MERDDLVILHVKHHKNDMKLENDVSYALIFINKPWNNSTSETIISSGTDKQIKHFYTGPEFISE